jgi:putative NADH-flavin reductase
MSDKSALEDSWDENRKLRKKVDILTNTGAELLQHIEKQDAEIAGLTRDAKRYRFLRKYNNWDADIFKWNALGLADTKKFDALVDKQIAAQEPQ